MLKQTSSNIIETYLDMYILILQEENFVLFSELLEKIINSSHAKRFRYLGKDTIFEDIKHHIEWTPPRYFECRKNIKNGVYLKNIFKSICVEDYNKTEQVFSYILEKNVNVKYWYKNGDKGEFYFSIPYKKDNIIKNFYPDFIVKYNDNSVGIYDTKSEMTASDGEAKEKAEREAREAYVRANQELLASIIYCEAGNQPYEGQVAVGAVVMNRIKSSSYPDTMEEVIYQSGQFSPAMSGWLDRVRANQGYTEVAMQAAEDALAGSNPIGDCLYFSVGGYGTRIGDHLFH